MTVKQILKQRGLAPKKRFGQNFLIDPHMAERIVAAAGVAGQDTILEIGVGLGALTRPLAARAGRVIGLEIDAGLVRWQQEEGGLPENVLLRHQDILKADLAALAAESGGRLKIVANLPYSLSNPLLFKLIEGHQALDCAVVMLQKEVGERLMADPGSKAYGIISVLIKTCAVVTPLLEIAPANFHPRPKVDSLVLRMQFHPPPARGLALPAHDPGLLVRVVHAAFGQRRKTLANALAAGLGLAAEKQEVERRIRQAGFSQQVRGEQLSLEDFVALVIAFGSESLASREGAKR